MSATSQHQIYGGVLMTDDYGDKFAIYPIAGGVEILADDENLLLSPKKARKFAKALKKAARKAEG